jgi:hypothetical protein
MHLSLFPCSFLGDRGSVCTNFSSRDFVTSTHRPTRQKVEKWARWCRPTPCWRTPTFLCCHWSFLSVSVSLIGQNQLKQAARAAASNAATARRVQLAPARRRHTCPRPDCPLPTASLREDSKISFKAISVTILSRMRAPPQGGSKFPVGKGFFQA